MEAVEVSITPLDLLRQAIAQGVSVEQLERLQGLYERWDANQARKACYAAKNAFKADAPTIFKNKHVKIKPKDSSKCGGEYDHATLDHVCDQVIGALAKQDLSHDLESRAGRRRNRGHLHPHPRRRSLGRTVANWSARQHRLQELHPGNCFGSHLRS
jgi:hypothetical protein